MKLWFGSQESLDNDLLKTVVYAKDYSAKGNKMFTSRILKVRLLLFLGANPNAEGSCYFLRNKVKNLPLMEAAVHGMTPIVRMLINGGANVNVKYGWRTPLTVAYKYPDVIKLLLNSGADVNVQLYDGMTALMTAVGSITSIYEPQIIDTVRLLIAHGADVNLKKKADGRTALMQFMGGYCFKTIGIEVAKMLIEKCNPEVKDDYGRTSLMEASEWCRYHTVKMLLDKGADVNARDKSGKSALMIVSDERKKRHPGQKEIIDLLRAKGATQ